MTYFTRTFCTVIMCLTLAACLPGKKQEEAVIEKAADATDTVRLEKVAADMGNAALTLMASNIPTTNNDNLQTFRCGDNKQVVAYVPKTSKLTRNGTMPADMANRMRSRLQLDFTPDAVKKASASDLSSCPGISIENIALNSPVLVLQSFANEQAQRTDPEVVQINIENCKDANGKAVPGIIVKKTSKDGHVESVSHCGQRISGTVDLGLGETQMPNWKKRLAGDTTAYVPFRCVVRDKDKSLCVSVDDIDPGLTLSCPTTDADQNEYMANPVFDPTTGKHVTGPDRSCGRGWTGQLIARVKSQKCNLVRGKNQEKEIVTVKELAYVSAQCHRNNLVNLETACPVTSDNPLGTFFVKRDSARMKLPMALEPQPSSEGNAIKSPIALAGYQVPAEDMKGISQISRAQSVFIPTNNNLRNYTDPTQFMNALIKDMGDNMDLSAISECNIVGNTCITGSSPDHIVLIIDRSASMGSSEDENKLLASTAMTKTYQCQAGLKNLFKAEKAEQACSLVKNFAQTTQISNAARNLNVLDFIKSPWAKDVSSAFAPSGSRQELYTQIEEMLMDRPKHTPYLQHALATGWDCSGRKTTGSDQVEPFPANMFGTCTGPECGTTCPGQCNEASIMRLPSPPNIRRIDMANLILENIARIKMKPGTKLTVGSFVNDQPSLATTTYCPLERRNNAGTCDTTLELKNILNMLVRTDNTKAYVKAVEQEIIIPKSNGDGASCEPVAVEECTTETIPGEWETVAQAKAKGTFTGTDKENGATEYRNMIDVPQCSQYDWACEYERDNSNTYPQVCQARDACEEDYRHTIESYWYNRNHPQASYVVFEQRRQASATKKTCKTVMKTPEGCNTGNQCTATPTTPTAPQCGVWETVAQAKASGSIANSNQAEYRVPQGAEHRETTEIGCYYDRAMCDYYEGLQNPSQADIDTFCGAANRCEAEERDYLKNQWVVGQFDRPGGAFGIHDQGTIFAKERRIPCGANGGGQSCTPDTTKTEPAPWKTADAATADGTYGASILNVNRAYDTLLYDPAKYEYRSCGTIYTCGGSEAACGWTNNENSHECAAARQCSQEYQENYKALPKNYWDIEVQNTGNSAGGGSDQLVTYCTERREKKDITVTVPGTCTPVTPPVSQCNGQCDLAKCAAMVGSGDGWETYIEAKHVSTTPEVNAVQGYGLNSIKERSEYEYGDCQFIKADVNIVGANYCGGGVDDRVHEFFNNVFKTAFNTELKYTTNVVGNYIGGGMGCNSVTMPGLAYLSAFVNAKDGMYVPFITSKKVSGKRYAGVRPYDDEYEFCAKRRLKSFAQGNVTQTWKTATQAKADGTYNESDGKVADYEFRSCQSVMNCDAEQSSCDYSATDETCGPNSRLAQCLRSYNANISALPKDRWDTTDYSIKNCNDFASCHDREEVYCTERLSKSATGGGATNENDLLACLDCAMPAASNNVTVEGCLPAKNLFTGVTNPNCKTTQVAQKLDYRPAGYKGEVVTTKVKRYVLSKQGEAGAEEAPVGSMVAGVDYGGHTPLLKTLDMVVASPAVVNDMGLQKKIRFVLLTDGMATDSGDTVIKDLCDSTVGTTLLSKISPNPLAEAVVIGLSDRSTRLEACSSKLNDKFISSRSISSLAVSRINNFLAAAGGNSTEEALEAAREFCRVNFPAAIIYADNNVSTTIGSGGVVNMCRPFEIQK